MAPRDSSQLREAGLRKLVLARRWVVAASVTLTGVFTAIAANAFPGKTIKSSSAPTSANPATEGSSSTRQQQSTEGSQSSGSLKPPAEAPQSGAAQEPAPAQESAPAEQSEPAQPAPEAPVVSGGS